MEVIIHVAQARQEDIGEHCLRARPRIHHTTRKVVNFFGIREVRPKGMKLVTESLDALSIERAGRDCEVVATLAKTGAQCKHWVEVAKRTPC
jgi:hypothetical protein